MNRATAEHVTYQSESPDTFSGVDFLETIGDAGVQARVRLDKERRVNLQLQRMHSLASKKEFWRRGERELTCLLHLTKSRGQTAAWAAQT